ncbi:MAG TPA: methyltransferase domain-containing protein [Thermoleophilaceae bacterium]
MAGEEYRQASLKIWDEMAAGWEGHRGRVWDASRAVGEWMVDALDPQPGETVLELAAGVGDTGFAAARRLGASGKLITTDFSEQMVHAARRRAGELGVSNAEFRTLDAERMDLDDGSVDGVLCRWGYMLMADPAAALVETRRVLGEGGRVALSVWGDPQQNPWASIPARALLELTGAEPPDPFAPGIFAMASEERTRELLGGAGFEPRRVETVEMEWHFDSLADYWHHLTDVKGAIAMVVRALPEAEQDALSEDLARRLEPYAEGHGYRLPGMCLNVLAA